MWRIFCDPKATPIMFGMGLDGFSMSAISVPLIKMTIMELDKKKCEELVDRILQCDTSEEIQGEL